MTINQLDNLPDSQVFIILIKFINNFKALFQF